MFKIISKKEYENLNWFIEEQSRQIDELIKIGTESQMRYEDLVKHYCDLSDMIYKIKPNDFPPEYKKIIQNIRKLNEKE